MDQTVAALRPLLAGRLSGRLVDFGFGSQLTTEGGRALVALMADSHLEGLAKLNLQNNRGLGDDGTMVIASALSEGLLPNLEHLDLDGTGMGDAGATALAGALDGAPKLKTLIVGKNSFGDEAKEDLKAACKRRGVAAMKGYFDAL